MSGSRKLWVAVLAVSVAAGSAVMAAEGVATETPKGSEGKQGGEWFKAMDTDGNGTVSLAEYTVVQEKRIAARKEKMGDKWNAERAAKMPSPAERFKLADKDGNGELTPQELQDAHREGLQKHRGKNKHPAPATETAPKTGDSEQGE